ncbi:MAG: HEAT repeat domain-containing protein [Chitinophagales bacterium]
MSESNEVAILKESLLKSQWPKCNQIAQQLFEIGTDEAKNALIEGLKGKRHHIRTAAIAALMKFNDASCAEYIKPLLNDPAYETRQEAEKAIKALTGEGA